jgi:hypothetical protein
MQRFVLAALAASAIAGATPAVATTYQIMLPAATAVSGFITTDGATGLIGVKDVINYQLTWNVPSWLNGDTSPLATVTFTPANSVITNFDTVYATPTDLSFGIGGGAIIDINDTLPTPTTAGADVSFNGYRFWSQLGYPHSGEWSYFAGGVVVNTDTTPISVLFASAVPGDDDDHHHHHHRHHHLIEDGHDLFNANDHDPTTAVPEPSTWAMMLLGFAGLGFAFRRSRHKAAFA